MARLTGPLLSVSAKKSIARTVTYYHSRGMDLARQRVDPYQPRTHDQVAQRTLFSTAVALIVTLITPWKASWKTEASVAGRGETWLSRAVRALLNTGYIGTTEGGLGIADCTVYDLTTGLPITGDFAPKICTYHLVNSLGVAQAGTAVWNAPSQAYRADPLAADTYQGRWFVDGQLIASGSHLVTA